MSSTLGKLLEGALTNEMSKGVQQPIPPLSSDRQHVWRIITKDRQSAVSLTRSWRNDTIWVMVRFNISSEGGDDDDDDDDDGDGGEGDYDGEDGEDEDGEGDEADIIDCSISISKNHNSLLLNCSASSYGGFEPYRVRFIEESSLVLLHEPTAESEEQIKARDIGPDYSELSPQIQLEFKKYLERFEINQALANFVISFAEYKKHEETKRWYESVKNFVDHY